METPNTRARRKRELREIEERGSGVSWQSDEQLRNEFLMQSAAGECSSLLESGRVAERPNNASRCTVAFQGASATTLTR